MPATIPTAQLSRIAIFAVAGAAALSLAACGSSNDAKPRAASPTSSAATSSPSAKPEGKDWVKGMIDSVSGSTIQVSQKSGAATVDFTPSTKVAELTPAQLTDVTTGSCVSVRPDHHSDSPGGSAITAGAVRISTAVDGKCPAPKQQGGAATTPPPGQHRQTRGQVASVAGNTITVNSVDSSGNSSQFSVTVTDTTKYTKKTAADAQAIAQGKCLTALGTKDGGGALQATAITVQQADNGQCPESGGEHHRH
ncbi:hypothetical protein GCM10009641_54820 [Mycobacterium cookii]|uniref:DUF5666 domain-containing protein n=1 Tax=Mycobacterium cookii TaxID=1775 RepID=A0A7I7KT30_9MYCO|nr:DUF5666 domain-containing protein [Mycobacterium cookii]MCV7332477.1 hypothetical protein [Mycobacterium cookii]BBX44502.1 hypothetical protein MCOO_05170 [Mycobacterium cookii]